MPIHGPPWTPHIGVFYRPNTRTVQEVHWWQLWSFIDVWVCSPRFHPFCPKLPPFNQIHLQHLSCFSWILGHLINIKYGQFTTSVLYKAADAHSYLYFHSSHHPNTKASIPYSQLLRLWRLCQKKTFSCNLAGCLSFSQPMVIPHQSLKMHWVVPNRSPGPVPLIRLLQLQMKDPSSQCFTILTTSQTAGFSGQTGIFLKTTVQLALPFGIGLWWLSRKIRTYKDWNLREILIHSNLHSRANSAPGTVPCSTDRCKACLHLCADTSIRDPNGHRSVKRTFHLSERQPGIRHHLSVLQPHLCWWYFQVPCGLFFGASGWHLPQLQHACSPAL